MKVEMKEKFKNPLWQVILLILIIFLFFGLFSFVPSVKIAGYEIHQSEIKQLFYPPEDLQVAYLQKPNAITGKNNAREPLDTTKQRILWFGDSMLEKLMWRAKAYADSNGHQLYPIVWYSASTKWYGECDTIDYYIKKYKPSYVLFVMGANELFIRNIFKRRHQYVQNIIKKVGKIPYLWVGPPNWKDDTGINDMIKAFVPQDQYYESQKLTLARAKDGAHPTITAAGTWMDSIAVWIVNKSHYPIVMNNPGKVKKTYPHPILLQPMY